MIQLSFFMWAMAALFGYIGFTRGWNKEIISTSGIILGLFALFEFDDVLIDLLVNLPLSQAFLVRVVIFGIIVYFAYQTRALIGQEAERGRGVDGRDQLQTNILGGLVGFLNGYLIWGSMWYFMHITDYPLAPYISRPTDGPSADFIESLPLFVLAGGPTGDGNLLAAAMIVLFLIVLIVI